MHIGVTEILIVVLIVILLFGPGRIEKIFSEMGKGIHSFKDGLQGKQDDETTEETATDKTAKKKSKK